MIPEKWLITLETCMYAKYKRDTQKRETKKKKTPTIKHKRQGQIARGTTDSVTRVILIENSALWMVNLATRWHHLPTHQSGAGALCISCNVGHEVASLALITNFATRWGYFHGLRNWPPGGAPRKLATTWLFASVTNLVTRWRHLHQLQIRLALVQL